MNPANTGDLVTLARVIIPLPDDGIQRREPLRVPVGNLNSSSEGGEAPRPGSWTREEEALADIVDWWGEKRFSLMMAPEMATHLYSRELRPFS